MPSILRHVQLILSLDLNYNLSNLLAFSNIHKCLVSFFRRSCLVYEVQRSSMSVQDSPMDTSYAKISVFGKCF